MRTMSNKPSQQGNKLQDIDYRKEVISKGLQHVKSFSWKKTGEQTVALYKEFL